MGWVEKIDELYDFIGLVVLRAPDQFPRHDFLAADEQLDLERAFGELGRGAELVGKDFPEKVPLLNEMLAQSLAFYRAGDQFRGAHRLQDFQDAVFKRQ